ncbi:MAG: hypothetical protein LBK61_00765 [Spirochaetaceae bacterium]|nr:hypothetical protein [Spirochaetaceae bacterium]
MPLRGAQTLRVFIPLRIIFDANPTPILAGNQRGAGTLCGGRASPAEYPCGGRKPFGFSSHCASFPSCESYPDSSRESAAGRQNTVMRRLCFPCGRAMPPHDGILPAGDDAG